MASIVEILSRKYVGREWRMEDAAADLYANLFWLDAAPKPSEAEIRAFSAEVDALIAAENKASAAQKAILSDRPDAVLTAVEILVEALFEVASKIQPAALTGPFDSQIVQRMQTLRQRIRDERAR